MSSCSTRYQKQCLGRTAIPVGCRRIQNSPEMANPPLSYLSSESDKFTDESSIVQPTNPNNLVQIVEGMCRICAIIFQKFLIITVYIDFARKSFRFPRQIRLDRCITSPTQDKKPKIDRIFKIWHSVTAIPSGNQKRPHCTIDKCYSNAQTLDLLQYSRKGYAQKGWSHSQNS